jgi:hypothetical protein
MLLNNSSKALLWAETIPETNEANSEYDACDIKILIIQIQF